MTPPNESALTASLIPCRFCGNEVIRLEADQISKFAICNYCHAQGPVAGEYEDAAKYWNERKASASSSESALAAAREINKLLYDYFHTIPPEEKLTEWFTKHSAAQQQEIHRLKEMITLGLASDIPSMDKLIQERDQLSARLAEMEKALREIVSYDDHAIFEIADKTAIFSAIEIARKALASTPSELEQKEKE